MSRMDRAARIRKERRLKAETETTDDFGVGRVAGRKRMQDRANGTTTGGSTTTTPATKAKKDYSKKKADGGVTFGEAFNYYRNEKKQKTFTWDGKKYNTKLLEEAEASTGKTGTGKTGTGKADDKKKKKRRGFLSGLFKKSTDGKTAGERFRDKKAGGGMMKKKGYAKGGMTKKGYANGGMTKKGYKSGGLVNGKPRGVGAAVRGYGKALKLK